MKLIRQGDVLLVPIQQQALPIQPKATRQPVNTAGKLVLAIGETTAHYHAVDEDDAELIAQGEKMLLSVFRNTTFATLDSHTHQPVPRHTPIELPGGLYEVRLQREALRTPRGMPQRFRTARD